MSVPTGLAKLGLSSALSIDLRARTGGGEFYFATRLFAKSITGRS